MNHSDLKLMRYGFEIHSFHIEIHFPCSLRDTFGLTRHIFFRYGIQLGRKDFKVLVWLSIVVQTVVCLFMMSMSQNRLIISTDGGKTFFYRYYRTNSFSVSWEVLPSLSLLLNSLQASPHDPENFPFVVLGNKTDVDGGNSRVVRPFNHSVCTLI